MVINFMDMVISLILIVFPMLMYLVFSCYNILMNNRMRRVLLIMTICTSFYLSLNIDIGYKEVMIFCNIPILICYLKKEWMLGVILSILAIFNGYVKYLVIIVILLIVYLAIRKSNKKDLKLEFNKLVECLGGKDNILETEIEMSRFKVTLKDITKANKEGIIKLGAKGVVEIDDQLKIIFGSDAKQLRKFISELK